MEVSQEAQLAAIAALKQEAVALRSAGDKHGALAKVREMKALQEKLAAAQAAVAVSAPDASAEEPAPPDPTPAAETKAPPEPERSQPQPLAPAADSPPPTLPTPSAEPSAEPEPPPLAASDPPARRAEAVTSIGSEAAPLSP